MAEFVTAWNVCYVMKCLVVMKCLLRREVFVTSWSVWSSWSFCYVVKCLLRREVFVTSWNVWSSWRVCYVMNCYVMKCLVDMKCLLRHEVFGRHDRFLCCWQVLVLTHSSVHWLQEKRSKLRHCTLLSYVTSSLRVLPLNLSRSPSNGWEGSVCSHFPTPVLQLTYRNPYIYVSHRSGSCIPTSGFWKFWRLLQVKVILTPNASHSRHRAFSPSCSG